MEWARGWRGQTQARQGRPGHWRCRADDALHAALILQGQLSRAPRRPPPPPRHWIDRLQVSSWLALRKSMLPTARPCFCHPLAPGGGPAAISRGVAVLALLPSCPLALLPSCPLALSPSRPLALLPSLGGSSVAGAAPTAGRTGAGGAFAIGCMVCSTWALSHLGGRDRYSTSPGLPPWPPSGPALTGNHEKPASMPRSSLDIQHQLGTSWGAHRPRGWSGGGSVWRTQCCCSTLAEGRSAALPPAPGHHVGGAVAAKQQLRELSAGGGALAARRRPTTAPAAAVQQDDRLHAPPVLPADALFGRCRFV